ncbi:hypothetical protein [Thalassotalea litorea]|uniref:hypothetical protein n=1 Tax=Thalassotalea litorea TaxID=2020715 RepID=UPI00373700F9
MNKLDVLSVGIRLLGIFLLVFLLRDMPFVIETVKQFKEFNPESGSGMAFYLTISILAILVSLIMIKFPVSVSKMLTTSSKADSPKLEGNAETIQITGVLLLGIYILSWAIPDLINNIIGLWQAYKYTPNDTVNIAYIWNALITTIIEIAIGFYCALDSYGIVKMIAKLRAA